MPKNFQRAIARAEERDNRGKWQKALHQDWRSEKRVERTNAQAKANDDFKKSFDEKIDKELQRRGLSLEDLKIPTRS